MFRIYQLLILSIILGFSKSFLTNTKQDTIESINEKLNIKHLNIVKDFNFQIDNEILFFIKKLSQKNIYASALSVMQMNDLLNEYYYTSYDEYWEAKELGDWDLIYKKKSSLVHPPKTLVLLQGKKLKKKISDIFTVSIFE